MLLGITGCLLYVIGDFLFAATGPGQSTETIGLFTRVAYLDMAEWRMWASILCGFVGSLLYYMGFHQMHGLLDARVTGQRDRIWVRLFKVAYITGTVAWTWVHAMFMTDALIFKHVFDAYGDMQAAADIANRVFYANAPGMAAAYILCDVGLTITMIALVWKRIIPLKSTGAHPGDVLQSDPAAGCGGEPAGAAAVATEPVGPRHGILRTRAGAHARTDPAEGDARKTGESMTLWLRRDGR